MRVALTGTPGTGKSTVASRLADTYDVVHLRDIIEEADLVTERDDVRETDIVDIEGLIEATAEYDEVVFESHLSHHLPVERVVVLRCEPAELETRLRSRGESARSISENAEGEALDLILSEAVAGHGRDAVYEIDTTDRSIDEVSQEVSGAIEGTIEPRVGIVDFTGYL